MRNVHDTTDPQPNCQPSFILDGLTNDDEIHKMFSSKHNIEHFENGAILAQIHSSSITRNEMFP